MMPDNKPEHCNAEGLWTDPEIERTVGESPENGYILFDHTKDNPELLIRMDTMLFAQRPDLVLKIGNEKNRDSRYITKPLGMGLTNALISMKHCRKICIHPGTGESPDFIGHMQQLKMLEIRSGNVFSIRFIEHLPQLEQLFLKSEVDSMEPLNRSSVKELYTESNHLDMLEKVLNLEKLTLAGWDVIRLPDFAQLPNLKTLIFAGIRMEDDYLTNLDKLVHLETLSLQEFRFIRARSYMDEVLNLPQLKTLDIDCSDSTGIASDEEQYVLDKLFTADRMNMMSRDMYRQVETHRYYQDLFQ